MEKMTPLEYARAMAAKFGKDAKVTWLTAGDLIDLLERLEALENRDKHPEFGRGEVIIPKEDKKRIVMIGHVELGKGEMIIAHDFNLSQEHGRLR